MTVESLSGIIAILQPLPSEERMRVMRAALAFLGEGAPSTEATPKDDASTDTEVEAPPRARLWMKQNTVTAKELIEVFHVSSGSVEVIASHLPGKSKKDQTLNAYVLAGVVALLATGDAAFEDKTARMLCERFGCYDPANHSTIIRDRGNEFSGAKEKGWTLTAPGLKRAAEMIKEMAKLKT